MNVGRGLVGSHTLSPTKGPRYTERRFSGYGGLGTSRQKGRPTHQKDSQRIKDYTLLTRLVRYSHGRH